MSKSQTMRYPALFLTLLFLDYYFTFLRLEIRLRDPLLLALRDSNPTVRLSGLAPASFNYLTCNCLTAIGTHRRHPSRARGSIPVPNLSSKHPAVCNLQMTTETTM